MDINFQKLIRVGKVSSTNPEAMTVRVTFPDESDLVSNDLSVICQGSKNDKDYWMPDVGEQVVCIFLPNGRNTGYCLGTFFSTRINRPQEQGKRRESSNIMATLKLHARATCESRPPIFI